MKRPAVARWPRHLYFVSGTEGGRRLKADASDMGGKAYNLQRMAAIGLPVPPALVIGTRYTQDPDDAMRPVFEQGMPALEQASDQRWGDARNPLIVSVRSGAPVSMPGMMETLLNVGLCDATLPGLLRQTGNPRLVWDAYRRLIATYGEVVAGLPGRLFEDELDRMAGDRDERRLDFGELRDLSRRFLSLYEENAGRAFPQDVDEQLKGAIGAVFDSWHAAKAQEYRRLNRIDEAMGTAVTIQRMVFGNAGSHSGAGVGFTRNPSTGEPRLWVDFLSNAQGEDVVSGRRIAHGHDALEAAAAEAWRQLEAAATSIEREFRDMQDFEFTVQDGVLHMLQTRNGKRTPLAAARIALDLLDQGLIDAPTAIGRTAELREEDIGTLRIAGSEDASTDAHPLARAIAAGGGVACGEISLDAARSTQRVAEGIAVVLVRQDAETGDIAALETAGGLLTQRGARTSHAAVVARQMGKVCLVGCEGMKIDLHARTVMLGGELMREGDIITLDGNTGAVYRGAVKSIRVPDEALIERLRALRSMQVKGASE